MNSATTTSMGWSVSISVGNHAGPGGSSATTSSTKSCTCSPVWLDNSTTASQSPSWAAGEALAIQLLAVHEVDLRQHEDLLRARALELSGHPLVARTDRLRRVHEEGDHVHVLERLERRRVQLLAEGVMRLVQARRVHEDELEALAREHRAKAMARSLRRVRRDGDLLAHNGVDQRGLAPRSGARPA